MKINTMIKKYQEELIEVINRAGADLPPVIVQLILQNILLQVNQQVDFALKQENIPDIQMTEAETIQND